MKFRLCAQIAGNDGAKIDIRVFIRNIHQGQSHEFCVTHDDVGSLGNQLFCKGNGLIGATFSL